MMQRVAKTTTPWIIGRSKFSRLWTASRPSPGRPKIVLGEDRAAERDADVHAEHRHDRQQRVAEHVAAHHLRLGRALGARRAHVVLAQRVHHVGADHPHVDRGEQEREGDPGQDQVVGPVDRARRRSRSRRVDEVAVAGVRRPARACSRRSTGGSSPIQTTGSEIPNSTKTIAALSSSERGRSAERIPIGSASSIQRIAPPNTSEAVTGAASRIDLVDVLAVRERVAERAVDHEPLQEQRVLHRHRPVEPEEVLRARDARPPSRAARRRAGPGRGDDEEDHVRDHRDGDEEHARPRADAG